MAAPPEAQIRPVVDHYGSVTIVDSYRWLEQKGPERDEWIRAQRASADHALAAAPGATRLAQSMDALEGGYDTIPSLALDGDALFYLRRRPQDDVARLFTRSLTAGPERILIDPEALPDARAKAEIEQFAPSLDGNYVAYTLAESGPDSAVLRVHDVIRNTDLHDRIPGARYAQPAWRPDSTGFYYTRWIAGEPGAPVHPSILLHRLGANPERDPVILDGTHLPFPFQGRNAIPHLIVPPSSEYAIAVISDGITPDLAIYTAPISQLAMSPAPWLPLATQADGVTQIVSSGSLVFMRTHAGAPGFRVVSEDLADPGFDKARTVVPAGQGVITGIAAGSDALYVARRDGVSSSLFRLDYNEIEPIPVWLPYAGSIPQGTDGQPGGMVADPRSSGLVFALESWTRPQVWYRYETHLRRALDLGLSAIPPGPSGIDAIETTARAADGTSIPLSIIARHGAALDHARPTIIDTFGSFGYVYAPRYAPAAIAWAQDGGVFAIAHVRGGGELGETWHEAGSFAKKPNTGGDLLACADALTKLGYTNAAHLAAMGTNAGALAVADAMERKPDAFRAVVLRDGLFDPLRSAVLPGGIGVKLEFGDPGNAQQLPLLMAADPYLNIKDGTEYPAALVTASETGTEIPVWQSLKFAARLQASNPGQSVLLRVADDENLAQDPPAARARVDAEAEAFILGQMETEDPVAAPASRHHARR